jgi:TRAP-type C4-dicarboxylate transport system substrate-binding protein
MKQRAAIGLLTMILVVGCSEPEPSLAPTIGGMAPEGTAGDLYFRRFADALTKSSGGELTPELLTRRELGADEQIFSALRRGRIQLAMNGAYVLSTAVPEFAVLGMPFLFESETEIDFLLEHYVTPPLAERLEANGIKLLAFMPVGWINFYGVKPLLTPAEIKGLRLRQANDLANRGFAQYLQADVIPLPGSEVIGALQTGLAEAGTTVTLNYLWSGLAGYAPHFTVTQHAFLFNALSANLEWWETLSASQQQAVLDSMPPEEYFVGLMRKAECKDIGDHIEKGLQVHLLDSAQRETWAAATLGSHEPILETLGPSARQTYNRIQAGKAAFRAESRPNAPRGIARCSTLKSTGG